MTGKDQENLLRIYKLLVEVSKEVLVDFFRIHLTKHSWTFEDFINLSQHEIYHLCYNDTKCCERQCKVSKTNAFVSKRILHPPQLGVLLDNNTRKPCHKSHIVRSYCCCMAKQGIQPDILDVTLANCLLINFCQDVFWDCCLTQSTTFENFLNNNKHSIYHLIFGNQWCCRCSIGTCTVSTNSVLPSHYWNQLYSANLTGSCKSCKGGNVVCICSVSAYSGIPVQNLDHTCTIELLKNLCQSRKALDQLTSVRNKYAHPDKTSLSSAEYTNEKINIRNSVLVLARHIGNESEIREKLDTLDKISLDEQLCIQYKNVLLEQISRTNRLEELITDELPKQIKYIVEDSTEVKFKFLEEKLDELQMALEGTNEQYSKDDILRLQAEGCLIEDFVDSSKTFNDQPNITDGSTFSGFKTCLNGVLDILSMVNFIRPEISAGFNLVTIARSLYAILNEEDTQGSIERFMEEKRDEEMFMKYKGIIELYRSAAVFLKGFESKKLTVNELKFVFENVKPFHGVEFMGTLWKHVDTIKRRCNDSDSFTNLMKYIQAYMYLASMRDMVFVVFCKILEDNCSFKILRVITGLMEYQRTRDKKLLEFLINPEKETIYVNFCYKKEEWPIIERLLVEYFFRGVKRSELSDLCDGEYVIRSEEYDNSCLFFQDIACTWFRWRYHEYKASRVKFVKHRIEGKTYFQIYSCKWPKYYARMGNMTWWVRGVTDSPADNNGLWEIIRVDSEDSSDACDDQLYMLAAKDSGLKFMCVDSFGRIQGRRCSPCLSTFFKIESRFVDAVEYLDQDKSDAEEVYENAID